MERKEEVSMLKIRSFLCQTKDRLMNVIKKMFRRHSKHMAATAYALSAVVLVFYFGDFADYLASASRISVDASSYAVSVVKLEETKSSDSFISDNQEYALISPDKHLTHNQTETVDDPSVELLQATKLNIYPLGQTSISQVTKAEEEAWVASAILTTKEGLKLSVDENVRMLDLTTYDDNQTTAESKKAKEEGLRSPSVETASLSNELGLASKALLSSDQEQVVQTAQTTSQEASQKKAQEKIQSEGKEQKQDITKENQKNKEQDKEKKQDVEVEGKTAETISTAEISVPKNLSLTINPDMKKKLSKEELDVLYRIVEAEATGEDIYGKILVANVVINRVNDEEFPDTISEVVFQKVGQAYQFAPTKDGRYWKVTVSKSTKEAVKRALAGEDYSEGALYFFARKLTTEKKASWFDNSLRKVVKYGCHEFYANK